MAPAQFHLSGRSARLTIKTQAVITAALTTKKARNTPIPPTWAAWRCASKRAVMSIAASRRASRTTRAPRIVMNAPAEMSERRRVVRFAAVLTGSQTGGLNRHARQGHEAVGKRQVAQHRALVGCVEPELPEPRFGGRHRQSQKRQRPQPAGRQIQIDRIVKTPAPVELPRQRDRQSRKRRRDPVAQPGPDLGVAIKIIAVKYIGCFQTSS